MTIKRAKDLISSLHGAAFRRATWDGRSWLLRSINTLRSLHCPEYVPGAVRGQSGWGRSVLRYRPQIPAEPLEVRVRRFR